MSEGNAHPYSWSSIINGEFDVKAIDNAGYPAVSKYLTANQDTVGISSARVTHIWTQNQTISNDIARSSGVENVVANFDDMLGSIDALIIARDDPESHRMLAEPYIAAEVPVFIDKPLTINREDLSWFKERSQAGSFIMSCSSMRYSTECRVSKTDILELGELELVTAVGKKDWIKYGVHLLEAVFSVLDDPIVESVQYFGQKGKDMVFVEFQNGIKLTIHLFMEISPTFQFSMFGRKGFTQVEIKNSYAMFKENILEFIKSVEEGECRLPFYKTYNIINTLISSLESANLNGKKIVLSQ